MTVLLDAASLSAEAVDRRTVRRPRIGDFVTVHDGFYGQVLAQRWIGLFPRPEGGFACDRLLLVVDEHDVECAVSPEDCIVDRSRSKRVEVCDAVEDERPCQAWADRAVLVTAVDAFGEPLPDELPERWAACSYHLPAALCLATEWFGDGIPSTVSLGEGRRSR